MEVLFVFVSARNRNDMLFLWQHTCDMFWKICFGRHVWLQKSCKTYFKHAVNTHTKTFKNTVHNSFFKNANFVARLLFETIFERASQKEKKWATFEKWKLSDWPKNPKSNCSWTFGVRIIHPEHPSTPFHSTPLHCIPGPGRGQGVWRTHWAWAHKNWAQWAQQTKQLNTSSYTNNEHTCLFCRAKRADPCSIEDVYNTLFQFENTPPPTMDISFEFEKVSPGAFDSQQSI